MRKENEGSDPPPLRIRPWLPQTVFVVHSVFLLCVCVVFSVSPFDVKLLYRIVSYMYSQVFNGRLPSLAACRMFTASNTTFEGNNMLVNKRTITTTTTDLV